MLLPFLAKGSGLVTPSPFFVLSCWLTAYVPRLLAVIRLSDWGAGWGGGGGDPSPSLRACAQPMRGRGPSPRPARSPQSKGAALVRQMVYMRFRPLLLPGNVCFYVHALGMETRACLCFCITGYACNSVRTFVWNFPVFLFHVVVFNTTIQDRTNAVPASALLSGLSKHHCSILHL